MQFGGRRFGTRTRTSWVVLVAAMVFGTIVAVFAVVGHVRSEPYQHGTTTTGTFEDVSEHRVYTRHGSHEEWSGTIAFVETDGTPRTLHVDGTRTQLTDGDTATVSYRPGHGGARWVRDEGSGWVLFLVGGIGFAVVGSVVLVRRLRRRTTRPTGENRPLFR